MYGDQAFNIRRTQAVRRNRFNTKVIQVAKLGNDFRGDFSILSQDLVENLFFLLLSACNNEDSGSISSGSDHGTQAVEYERGPHGGRVLKSGDFSLELSIFETGAPPEFRAWATSAGKPTDPQDVSLEVRLTRLGNRVGQIKFQSQDDFLRGKQVVYEPHSFVVSIDARAATRSCVCEPEDPYRIHVSC